jgi:hypothetical protein
MRYDLHGLPVETSFVGDASAVRQLCKVNIIGQIFKASEILFEGWGFERYGCEEETGWSDVVFDFSGL